MDITNQPVVNEYSLQIRIEKELTQSLQKYVQSNGLYTFFKDSVFGYNSERLTKKAIRNGKTGEAMHIGYLSMEGLSQ